MNSFWRDIGGVSLPGEFGSECHLDNEPPKLRVDIILYMQIEEVIRENGGHFGLWISIRGETQCRVASVKPEKQLTRESTDLGRI